jgi:hypothetical protein
VELTRYQQSGAHASEIQVAMKEGDHYFLLAETAEKILFGESGNLGRLCVGRRARVLKRWLYP